MDVCDSWSNLRPILPVIPFHSRCRVFCRNIYVFEPSELFGVGRKDRMVFARFFDADAIVGKRLGGMEVENKQQPGTLKDDDFIGLIFKRDVSLRGGEPAICLFSVVHCRIKLVEILVAKIRVINDIPLPSCVVE